MTRLRKFIFILLLVGVLGGVGFLIHSKEGSLGDYETKYEEESEYVRFSMEIFDIILDRYWQKVSEADLAELYRLSFARAVSTSPQDLATTTREAVASLLGEGYQATPSDKRGELAVNTGIIALANLAPQGRSGLLSHEQEMAFRDNVNNINPTTGEPDPTLTYEEVRQGVLYIDLTKISATTIQEVADLLREYEGESLRGLILDVRGNAGGALDFARYFMSMFLGPNQYVYDYFHQGELDPERTPNFSKVQTVSDLSDVAILTDGDTQSTAELLTAIFKRFRLGKSIGTKTKGWGTVENTFPIETTLEGGKYSVLLVHSLTLRDDGEPIESRGVDPDVDITKDGWQRAVRESFSSQTFANEVINILSK